MQVLNNIIMFKRKLAANLYKVYNYISSKENTGTSTSPFQQIQTMSSAFLQA